MEKRRAPAPRPARAGVSVRELAEALACSTRTVEKYAESGLVVKIERGRYEFVQSIANVVSHLRKQAALQVSQDGKNDQISENVLFKQAQRRMAEMRIAQMEGSLIPVSDVEDAWTELVLLNRQLIESIPRRARAEMPQITGHDQKQLAGICHELLKETALGEGRMPKLAAPKVDA